MVCLTEQGDSFTGVTRNACGIPDKGTLQV